MLRLCACKTYGKPTRPHLNFKLFTPAKPRNPHACVSICHDGVAHYEPARTTQTEFKPNIVRFGSSKQTNQLFVEFARSFRHHNALHPRVKQNTDGFLTANCNTAKSEIWLSRKRTPDKRNALRTNFHTSSQEVKTTPKTHTHKSHTQHNTTKDHNNLLCYSCRRRFAVRIFRYPKSDHRDGASTRTRTQRPAKQKRKPKPTHNNTQLRSG